MDWVGISDLAHAPYDVLSGGQQQLALIARAIAQDTGFILLDEPTSALDFKNQTLVWETLRQLADQGRGILACSHDPNHVAWFCDTTLVLDPDLIVLVTAWGYHPPEELYQAPYYQGLQGMRAVRERAVTVLPWTPCNCEKRLEYPIDIMVMAKAAYPERFSDIRLDHWLIEFYQQVYGVDPETAGQLLSRQWMDWTRKE